ncbi:hypothetical protein D3C85_1656360 [compost metagenome]
MNVRIRSGRPQESQAAARFAFFALLIEIIRQPVSSADTRQMADEVMNTTCMPERKISGRPEMRPVTR